MRRRRILIIDDEEDIREIAQTTLDVTTDWEVLTARSGTEGVARALADRPDAVLLDVMMPVMDGAATLTALRTERETAEIPIIFLTAKAQAAEQRRFLELGANGVITKPFDPLMLARQVAEILGWTP